MTHSDRDGSERRQDEVLVQGSYFQRADLPRILGNYMRATDEAERDAKHAHIATQRAFDLADEWDREYGVCAESVPDPACRLRAVLRDAPAGPPLHEQADRDGDNVPSEAGELMARLSYADLEAIVERAEKAEAEVETLRIVISVYQGGSAELRATIVRARELAEKWDAEADAYEDERPAAARAVLYCSRELLATLRGHVCAECTDCLHDGNKCCGCYDGACCQRAPDQQNAPRRLTYDTGHHEVTTHDKMRAEVGGLRAELARVEALADEDTHHLRSGVVGMVRLSDLAAALRGPAPTEEPS